jgi:[CysO sulfur-carrier protein]-S-L-cysteine hydrolase
VGAPPAAPRAAGSARRRSVACDRMRIGRDQVEEIVAHAREEVPDECCGLVGGRDGRVSTVYRARNAEASPLRYSVHPSDQFQIMERMEETGEELVGIYHSHTKSAAYPSQTDINLAEMWPDPLYLICSLAGGEPDLRAFAIRDGGVEEVELAVE